MLPRPPITTEGRSRPTLRIAAQRWITYRARYALGDLFLGRYERLIAKEQGL
ncbi:MAG: hypothetical protein JOY71_09195 [Acetobacteraceae bacterium]|nr:hypothetical protein [Acetobacteraceae bacterium]